MGKLKFFSVLGWCHIYLFPEDGGKGRHIPKAGLIAGIGHRGACFKKLFTVTDFQGVNVVGEIGIVAFLEQPGNMLAAVEERICNFCDVIEIKKVFVHILFHFDNHLGEHVGFRLGGGSMLIDQMKQLNNVTVGQYQSVGGLTFHASIKVGKQAKHGVFKLYRQK